MSDDTLDLVRQAARGDAAALAELMGRHLPAVRAFVRSHMGPQLRARESSSDIVQSVCRELLTHQDVFRHEGPESFTAWLFATARRKIQKRARDLGRAKRDAAREVPATSESSLAALGGAYARISSPSGRALRAEEVAALETALDRLAAEQREVITMAHLAGMSRTEIGARMGRTEEAVRALLHRAMARLSLLLQSPD